jgi:hypothetical protein
MRFTICALALLALSLSAAADDAPSFKVGATIFADYTLQTAPDAFNVGRAYINVTGNLNKRISFRITPDVVRESGSGSSLAGSQQFRLKYAFAQYSGDQWWLRFGMQQTPFLDATEAVYRYRFQGTLFPEREGYLASSDTGASVRYVLPGDRGDVHAGVYNGEGYSKAEANDQKALQVRATYKPLKGLRTTLFVAADNYAQGAKRTRAIAQATYEHKRFHAGADVIRATDRDADSDGWSVWATPRLGNGWELLLRHDQTSARKRRDIAGIAYWVPALQKVTCALLADVDTLAQTGKPRDTRVGLKMLLVF